jgi:hypothetical protein
MTPAIRAYGMYVPLWSNGLPRDNAAGWMARLMRRDGVSASLAWTLAVR